MAKSKVSKVVRTLTIDRAKWLNFQVLNYSFLNPRLLCPKSDLMCCLGIYLEKCGVPKEKLNNKRVPSQLGTALPEQAKWLISDSDSVDSPQGLLIDANDHIVCNKTRENIITKLFAAHGNVKVKFTGLAATAIKIAKEKS